jgi:Holliday junction resolvasome RuvABC endonuclease subunit
MIALGIDQSFTNIGVAVVEGDSIDNAKILLVRSYNYKGLKSKTEKRAFVSRLVKHIIEKFHPNVIGVERVRLFSQGNISMATIVAHSTLIATIVDSVWPQKVYSYDTRSWKSHVCGNSHGIHNADKGVSVRYVHQRFGEDIGKNDDETDAICQAIYLLEGKKWLKKGILKEEH